MNASRAIFLLFLLFPWRTSLWNFSYSEGIFAALILCFVFATRRILVVSKLIFPLFVVISLLFICNVYFDVALIVRLLIPLTVIPLVKKTFLSQRDLKYLAWLSLLFVVLNYLSFFSPLVNLYKGRTSDGILTYQYFRASGLHIYPSDFSFFCLLLIVRLKEGTILKFLLLLAIALSASRAGIAFALFYVFINNIKYSLLFIGMSLPFIKSILSLSPYMKLTFEALLSGAVDGSIQHRLGEWDYVFRVLFGEMQPVFKNYDLLGLDIVEGFYSYYIVNYGYIGLVVISILILYFLVELFNSEHPNLDKLFILFLLIFWFMASDILNHTKNLFFGYLLIYSRNAIHYKHE